MSEFIPAYQLLGSGELASRATQANDMLRHCNLCAWECGVDRIRGEQGQCYTGMRVCVSSHMPHHDEERPISGTRGSGTIFFTRCNLHCVYCQNFDISQTDRGISMDEEELAAIMLNLQRLGCHNINLVSPSHVIPQILGALVMAAREGLKIPIVYNTGGYDSLTTLHILDGIVDIYMPDMKYTDEKIAQKYSKISHYPQSNQAAIREMHRQVGDLILDSDGIALRGLLVRHLVLPGNLAGTNKIVRFLSNKISPHTYLNLMDQYRPEYHAIEYPELDHRISHEEYQQALDWAHQAGLERLDKS